MTRPARDFRSVSRRTQIERMRHAGHGAVRSFGLGDARLRLLVHDFNTTFRVDTADGERFALRMSLNSTRGPHEVMAETGWVSAIAAETDIVVPRPIRSTTGELVVTTPVTGRDRPAPAVVYSWLDGPDVGTRVTVADARKMGALAAGLHDHASGWTPPVDAVHRSVAAVLMDSPDRLSDADLPWLDDHGRAVLGQARTHCEHVLAPVFSAPRHLIHGDIHMWNVKRVGDRLGVFDFDDCGLGVPLQDLAITAYYLGDRRDLREALIDGYSRRRAVPAHTVEQFEALVAARNLLLLNDVVDSVTAGTDEFVVGYARRTATRLRSYLDTGVFPFDP